MARAPAGFTTGLNSISSHSGGSLDLASFGFLLLSKVLYQLSTEHALLTAATAIVLHILVA